MSVATSINLDTSILLNYLYSTVIPNQSNGGTEFEDDKGCREYFDTPTVLLVAGGKVCGEFINRCEHREVIYQDMIDFMIETGDEIFAYNPHERDIYIGPNDPGHIRDNVQMNLANDDERDQLSAMRAAKEVVGKAQDSILESGLDETYRQFEHEDLRESLDEDLDVDHDCDVIVDAAFICRDHSISIFASLDSDITSEQHRQKIGELIEREFDPSIELTIIDPRDHTLN